jgi:hypothetical protein
MKTITNTIYPAFALFVLACLALSPQARAVCQEGCDLINGNTFLGDDALVNNTGTGNTAIGADALSSNTFGSDNTAIGGGALGDNIGSHNTATGWQALSLNMTGGLNTANGHQALYSNTTGNLNTATGTSALERNTTGNNNTASGAFALYSNTTGINNTADGWNALSSNTTGQDNIALGSNAGADLTTGRHNIDIGHPGSAGESNTIRIGKPGKQSNTYIAGISGATVPTGVAVIVDSSGHLGTTISSERFKDGVKPMDKASEAILALQPVTFRYKKELDPEGIPQFGLVAEQVEKVNPDLVARDDQGKPYTVRYDAVNAMLLNEFLKEHRTVQELKKEIAALTATVKEQSAQIQRVSVRIEARKQFPQVVVNER